MKQLGLCLNLSTKKTLEREFLEEMERVVPWAAVVQMVEPCCPRATTGRPPFAVETMLPIHYLQQWFGRSEPAMEEALHDVPLYREVAKLGDARARLPDETAILRCRLLERHNFAPAADGQRHPLVWIPAVSGENRQASELRHPTCGHSRLPLRYEVGVIP